MPFGVRRADKTDLWSEEKNKRSDHRQDDQDGDQAEDDLLYGFLPAGPVLVLCFAGMVLCLIKRIELALFIPVEEACHGNTSHVMFLFFACLKEPKPCMPVIIIAQTEQAGQQRSRIMVYVHYDHLCCGAFSYRQPCEIIDLK
ncbi:MAG: hypothetical protein GX112_00360 [Clostridiaceae bacterium]|jgi:hypothetical protein|nr:hypothetical protein [Clostridiaceae bacterium]